jgi:cis-L-3-hydroxyproline dehydratase
MYLTAYEKELLEGRFGDGVAEAMRIQVELGEAFDAERMVEISRAHVAFGVMESDVWFVNMLLKGGASCCVPPTSNPIYDAKYLKRIGQSEEREDSILLKSAHEAYKKMGIILTYNCTPYLEANVPYFGEVVAYSESSATVYVNSVCGARTNRESANSALAAAITGRVPLYGLLLDKNRKGEILVNIEATLQDDFDYHLLGYAASKKIGFRIPVFTGVPSCPSKEELTSLGAQLNTGGAVSMFHMVGVTPEAPDLETAFGGNSPAEKVSVTNADLHKIQQCISSKEGKIDFAMFGCPHYSLNQVQNAARLLEGKQIHKDVELWILTSVHTRELAKRMGYLGIIERAGGHMIADTCPDMPCWYRRYSGKVGITDSPKAAYYTVRRGIHYIVKRMPECIEAALKGGC